jgi:hypothetical protein
MKLQERKLLFLHRIYIVSLNAQMLEWLPIDLIVEIGILAGPDEYEQIAKTSERNAIILQNPHIIKATNVFIVAETTLIDAENFTYRGKWHSFNDMPAIIYNNGTRGWLRHGVIHRDNDQPAIIYSNGTREWYQNGLRHRNNDLPAVVRSDVNKEWYHYGKRIYRVNWIK